MTTILTENNDFSTINWVAGLSDPGEMIGCGMYQQLRRLSGENDTDYAARLRIELQSLPAEHRDRIEKSMQSAASKRFGVTTVGDGKIALAMAKYGGWHELGTVTEDAMDGASALSISGLGQLTYTKVPTTVNITGVDGFTTQVETGGFAVVRTDCKPNKVIAPNVGERYTIFTAQDMVDVFDELFAQGLQIETCGAIDNGARIWFQARMPKFNDCINGDEIAQYLHGTTTFDGTGSTLFFPTSYRAVCANTHRIAMKDRKDGISLRHTKNAATRKQAVRAALSAASKDFAKYIELGTTLANVKIDQRRYFEACADNIINKEIAGIVANGDNLRDGTLSKAIAAIEDIESKHLENLALTRFEKARVSMINQIFSLSAADTNGNGANDAWHCYNTISELADHGGIVKFRDAVGIELAERKQLGKLFGKADSIKQMAWDVAVNFAAAV